MYEKYLETGSGFDTCLVKCARLDNVGTGPGHNNIVAENLMTKITSLSDESLSLPFYGTVNLSRDNESLIELIASKCSQ